MNLRYSKSLFHIILQDLRIYNVFIDVFCCSIPSVGRLIKSSYELDCTVWKGYFLGWWVGFFIDYEDYDIQEGVDECFVKSIVFCVPWSSGEIVGGFEIIQHENNSKFMLKIRK